MADKLPKYNLATAQFTPVVFEGATYKPEQEDMSLLANSLAKLEERERTANEKLSAMDVAFGDIRSKLHQDKDTLQWFNDFSNKYKDQVASYARLGDYGNAINAAVRLGGEAANDAELIGRLKTSKQYEDLDTAQRARINKGITQDTYNWWKKNHKYNHVNIYDDYGNVVGAEEIDTPVPYDDVDFTKLAETAYRLITPDKVAKGSNTSVSSSHSVDGTGSSYSTASGSSRRVEKVRKEDILARMDELLPALPGGFSSVEQAFDVYVDKLKEMKESLKHMTPGTDEYKQQQQKIEKRELLMSNNGATITDYKEFCARMVTNKLFAQGLAYDWRSTETSSQRSNSSVVNTDNKNPHNPNPHTRTQTGDYPDDNNNPQPKPPLVSGPSAIKQAMNRAEDKANSAGKTISEYFNQY